MSDIPFQLFKLHFHKYTTSVLLGREPPTGTPAPWSAKQARISAAKHTKNLSQRRNKTGSEKT